MFHERCGRGRANSGNAVKFAHHLPFRTAVAVMCDAESVSFVAQGLNHAQAGRFLVDIERQGVAREIDLFKTLRNADKRHLSPYPHFIEGLDCGTQLSFTAIDHHQLWQRLPFGHHPGVATVQDLFHRCEVICSYNGLDVEVSVITLARFAVAKHHAARNRISALNIGVVETLYMSGFHA